MSVRTSMFLHLLKRGLLGRGNRPLIALIALTVAATMITAMLSLYYGLENKLNRDFRSYGANITVAAPDGQTLPDAAERLARSVLDSNSVVAPFAFAIAHTSDGGAVVVAGIPAGVSHHVNRRRPAQNLATHRLDATVVEVGLWLGLVSPIVEPMLVQFAEAKRNRDQRIAIGRPGFQQQHARVAALAQSVGKNTTGRSGANSVCS